MAFNQDLSARNFRDARPKGKGFKDGDNSLILDLLRASCFKEGH